jgi:hypothetical protein
VWQPARAGMPGPGCSAMADMTAMMTMAVQIEAQAERERILADERLRQLEQLHNARQLGAFTDEAYAMAVKLVLRTTQVRPAASGDCTATARAQFDALVDSRT